MGAAAQPWPGGSSRDCFKSPSTGEAAGTAADDDRGHVVTAADRHCSAAHAGPIIAHAIITVPWAMQTRREIHGEITLLNYRPNPDLPMGFAYRLGMQIRNWVFKNASFCDRW